MKTARRFYLDQAATTWPKLPEAIAAAEEFMRECGATSGRGAYSSARVADRWIVQARHNLARLFGGRDANDVALCTSGTHALNAALLGLIEQDDHVVTTAIEHNSVLRPLEHLRRDHQVRVSFTPCDSAGLVDLEAARRSLRTSGARAVVISHASNVTGRLQDIKLWSALAHEHDALLIVDASQTAGYVPVSMQELGIDVLASAGHKGLGALSGTGFLIMRSDIQPGLRPLMFGGTGTASEQLDFIPSWPQSVEVGNLNLPGVVSMAAAADVWLRDDGTEMMRWRQAWNHFVRGIAELRQLDQLRLIGHPQPTDRSEAGVNDTDDARASDDVEWMPIVSLDLPGWDIHEASAVLDASFSVETRAGFHCAALIHEPLGTLASGGTLRFSLSHHTSLVEVDEALAALRAIL